MSERNETAAERVQAFIDLHARFGGDMISGSRETWLTFSDLRELLAELKRKGDALTAISDYFNCDESCEVQAHKIVHQVAHKVDRARNPRDGGVEAK